MDTRVHSYDWGRLDRLQPGKDAEYLVKMEFTPHGCAVFSAEVRDRGIDFVVRTVTGQHHEVQVKSFRSHTGRSTP